MTVSLSNKMCLIKTKSRSIYILIQTILLILLIDSISCLQSKITEGQSVKISDFPFVVQIHPADFGFDQTSGSQFFATFAATGVIINKLWVLTHAFQLTSNGTTRPGDSILVVAGSESAFNFYEVRRSVLLKTHPEFAQKGHTIPAGDVGLIKVNEEFELIKGYVAIVKMNTAKDFRTAYDTAATIVGWGGFKTDEEDQFSDVLQKQEVKVTDCAPAIVPQLHLLCVKPYVPCGTDDGGPLIIDGGVVGLAVVFRKCKGDTGVYTSLHNYTEWITKEAN